MAYLILFYFILFKSVIFDRNVVSFEMVSLANKGGLNWLYKTFSKA